MQSAVFGMVHLFGILITSLGVGGPIKKTGTYEAQLPLELIMPRDDNPGLLCGPSTCAILQGERGMLIKLIG